MLQRHDDGPSFYELKQAVRHGRIIYLSRQSSSRSVAAVRVGGKVIPFIYNRLAKRIVTVLSREQAMFRLGDAAEGLRELKALYEAENL
jgi:hypothetical protein